MKEACRKCPPPDRCVLCTLVTRWKGKSSECMSALLWKIWGFLFLSKFKRVEIEVEIDADSLRAVCMYVRSAKSDGQHTACDTRVTHPG